MKREGSLSLVSSSSNVRFSGIGARPSQSPGRIQLALSRRQLEETKTYHSYPRNQQLSQGFVARILREAVPGLQLVEPGVRHHTYHHPRLGQ